MNQTIIGTVDQRDGSAEAVGISCKQQLDKFIADMDADLVERRSELAKRELLVAEKKAFCASFPETLPQAPENLVLSSNVYKADAEVTFAVSSYEQVLQLVDSLPGVPLVMIKAGCTTFIPEERYVKKEGQRDEVTPVSEVVYRLSTWVSDLQEEFTWWTHLAGKLVRVVAKTRKGEATNARARASIKALNFEGPLQEVTWKYENLPDGVSLQWAGGDARHAIPVTVHQPRGTKFRDAVAKPMTASVKVITQRCAC